MSLGQRPEQGMRERLQKCREAETLDETCAFNSSKWNFLFSHKKINMIFFYA